MHLHKYAQQLLDDEGGIHVHEMNLRRGFIFPINKRDLRLCPWILPAFLRCDWDKVCGILLAV
ncbi:hypothetical protein SCLCIDRAFT_1214584 [Scleroderma citrinum Foug A]|uniref:Uncharacterized protein n=1 Tax=Scleroderma citrinum Foug A TaxID=1036808 RepID=A0A0C3E3K3_9AGAM|nr:hypothetical protein SCLCIDRAFT_1214584 [Scleroderma citrinum Foug A]